VDLMALREEAYPEASLASPSLPAYQEVASAAGEVVEAGAPP